MPAKGVASWDCFARSVPPFLRADVMLADAFYCNYFVVATMIAAGVDVLFEQNGARDTGFRRGVSLGRRDHLVNWAKSKIRPDWLSAQQYAEFPDALTVREVLVDGQILVTTLVNNRNVREGALSNRTRSAGTWSWIFATSKPRSAWKSCAASRRG